VIETNRTLDVVVDSASWAPRPVPRELSTRAGSRQVDVLGALIYTALVTRPPTVHGFHLSDYWAWMRYFPAIAETSELRLCEEWRNVDSHQKTVLSDELGVGFTTQFITEAFDCSEFTDTLYVVNVLDPTKFSLAGGAKKGPQKSPDYIARDRQSDYIVLECKGTQKSRAALDDAIERGRGQKANISATNSARIKHSLVAGLFIPQWLSSEAPSIHVSDPRGEELEGLLSGQPRRRIDDAITQISLAKQLALAGLTVVPTHLGSSELGKLAALPEAARAEVETQAGVLKGDYRVIFDSADLRARMPPGETPTRATFSVRTAAVVLEQLMGAASVSEVISELSKRSSNASWQLHSEDFAAEVTTPLGFGFRLEVERGSKA
jgi:hypothetical protein